MSGRELDKLNEELDARDWLILNDLERFRLLTTRHVQRLHFPSSPTNNPTSSATGSPTGHATSQAATRACSRALLRLRDLGLAVPLARRIGGVRRGSASYIWQLGARGERLLRYQRGQTTRRRYLEPSLTFAKHTLAIAELAVGIIGVTDAAPQLALEALVTEPANWTSFIGPTGETRWLKPDLHTITTITDANGVVEEHTYFEVDLGTEHRNRIVAKCQLYAAYAATGAYQARHGVFPQVVWLSDDGARRRALQAAIQTAPMLPAELFRVSSTEEYLTEYLVGVLSDLPPPTTPQTVEENHHQTEPKGGTP